MAVDVELVRPSLALAASYFEFIDEMRAAGDTVWPTRIPSDGQSIDAFVAGLLAKETTVIAPGVVTESVYWAVVDGVIDDGGGGIVVGVIALRHELTEKLARFGGHVGYEVRPSRRGRGIATAMIRALMHTDRARSIGRVLITCAPTNVGSRKAIERAGGVLDRVVFIEEVARETCHYWIDAAADVS